MVYRIAVTGHRLNPKDNKYYPEGVTDNMIYLTCLQAIIYHVSKATSRPIFMNGGAIGFDQAMAAACADSNVRYEIYVPFEGQESKWPKPVQDRYQELIWTADRVIVTSSGGYEPGKMFRRNNVMIDQAQCVCTLFNGDYKSGTGQALSRAKERKIPIQNWWDKLMEIYERETKVSIQHPLPE